MLPPSAGASGSSPCFASPSMRTHILVREHNLVRDHVLVREHILGTPVLKNNAPQSGQLESKEGQLEAGTKEKGDLRVSKETY